MELENGNGGGEVNGHSTYVGRPHACNNASDTALEYAFQEAGRQGRNLAKTIPNIARFRRKTVEDILTD